MAEIKPRALWLIPPEGACSHDNFDVTAHRNPAGAGGCSSVDWRCNTPGCESAGTLLPADSESLSGQKAVVLMLIPGWGSPNG